MRKEHDVCTVQDCGRKHKARGYCQTHYMQFQRGLSDLGPIKVRVRDKPDCCVEDGCGYPVKAKGLCMMHYQRSLRHGHTKSGTRQKPRTGCAIAGCENYLYAKGLCHPHYKTQQIWASRGVDAARYQEMLAEQNGLCAICARPEKHTDPYTGRTKRLAIDHCHGSGKVRGLLCGSCNTALGLFEDDPGLLDRAKEYLAKHSASC